MNSLVLLTALTVTTGHCGGGKMHHAKKARAASCYASAPAQAPAMSACGGGNYGYAYVGPGSPMATMQSQPAQPAMATPGMPTLAPTKAVPQAVPTAPSVPAPPPAAYQPPTTFAPGLAAGAR